jgi:phosphate transport system substrate-binding protein
LASLTCASLLACCALWGSAAAASAATLTGAGSTFAAPIVQEWDAAWGTSTGNSVTYSAVGSGTGYKDIVQGLVDFGASDAPLSAYSNPPSNLIQIPWGLSAVGVGYNLPGIHKLHLTGPVVAQVYLGQITKWNDSRIRRLNPGVPLPNLTITPIHRSDGSGTTYAFTDYLDRVSPSWKRQVGSSTVVHWPVGPGGNGNSGVMAILGSTRGGMSYNEVSYLIAHQLPAAAIQNAAGKYEYPNLTNIAAAGNTVKSVPANREMHIVNPSRRVKNAYPISTFTYAIVPTNASQGALLRSFIGYAINGGQNLGPRIDFVPIQRVVRRASQAALARVQ